jgi:hypothetical protein
VSELVYLGKIEGEISVQFPSGAHMIGVREGRNASVVAYALDEGGANVLMYSVDKARELRAGVDELVGALAKLIEYMDEDSLIEEDWEALENGRELLAKFP